MNEESPVLLLLSQFGTIKNCRISPSFGEDSDSILRYPPSVVWSYKDMHSERSISLLRREISCFEGNYTWILKEKHSWILYPSLTEETSRERNIKLRDACAFLMKENPELCISANIEFRKLITFLLQRIAEK